MLFDCWVQGCSEAGRTYRMFLYLCDVDREDRYKSLKKTQLVAQLILGIFRQSLNL
jgi:hypothetical protein